MPYKNKIKNKEYSKEYRKEHKDIMKKWREENKEEIKKQRKGYRDINKHKIKVKNKIYRDLNMEKLKEYDKQRYKNRPKINKCRACGSLCADGFCGEGCRRKRQRARWVGKNNPNWKGGGIKKICLECGNNFSIPICDENQKYCSNECRGSSQIGKKNPNWKNGAKRLNSKIRELKENKRWRIFVFERDKYKCSFCNKVGGNIEAHHIDSFNDILLRNNINSIKDAKLCEELWDIDNGVTVCVGCHTDIDEYRFGVKLK